MDAPAGRQPEQSPAAADCYAAAFPSGITQAERRLDLPVALYGRLTTWTLDMLGLGAGIHVADVSCGTGALPPLLAERVGAAGRVIGIDHDPRLLQAARQQAPTTRRWWPRERRRKQR